VTAQSAISCLHFDHGAPSSLEPIPTAAQSGDVNAIAATAVASRINGRRFIQEIELEVLDN